MRHEQRREQLQLNRQCEDRRHRHPQLAKKWPNQLTNANCGAHQRGVLSPIVGFGQVGGQAASELPVTRLALFQRPHRTNRDTFASVNSPVSLTFVCDRHKYQRGYG